MSITTGGILMRRLIPMLAAVLAVAACGTTAPNVNTGAVSDPSAGGGTAAAQPTDQKAKAPTWGQKYTWPSGVAVEIPAPVACKPSKTATPQDAKRALKVTFKITNGSDKPFETSVLTVGSEVQFGGAKAELLIDISGPCKAGVGMESATVLPGKGYSYEVTYAVAAEPGEMQIALQPDFGVDKAVFTGQA
jgi:hypothetical protein